MASNLPLAGLRIVVTRPREQASKLCQYIEKLGGDCIAFPLLEITPLLDDAPLRASLACLPQFQLAIFISPNAVRYGMEAIIKAGGLPASLQVATIGSSSANALAEYGVKNVISPPLRFDSEALLALPEMQDVAHLRTVIFRGNGGRELLGDTLKLRGATVEYVTCYLRSKTSLDAPALFATHPDIITVSSSEALHHLWQMTSPAEKEKLATIPLFVSQERIAAKAHSLGLKKIITAPATDAGLLSALGTWAVHTRG